MASDETPALDVCQSRRRTGPALLLLRGCERAVSRRWGGTVSSWWTGSNPPSFSHWCFGRLADGENLVPNLVPNFVPDSANMTLAKPS